MEAWGACCAAVLLAVSTAAGRAEPPEGGEGPEIRSERVSKAKEGEERAKAKAITVTELVRQYAVTQIHAVMSEQQNAWNRGDVEAFMEGYWKSDELRFASGGTVTKGWQATLDRYRERYATREKMGTLSFSDLDVSVLSEDAALVFGRWKLERKDDAPGGLFTLLFRKVGGKWVIVHDHTSGE